MRAAGAPRPGLPSGRLPPLSHPLWSPLSLRWCEGQRMAKSKDFCSRSSRPESRFSASLRWAVYTVSRGSLYQQPNKLGRTWLWKVWRRGMWDPPSPPAWVLPRFYVSDTAAS